jgi:hypothetical protein
MAVKMKKPARKPQREDRQSGDVAGASQESTERARQVTSTREPQPEVQDRGLPYLEDDERVNDQGYDPENHMQRSAVMKEQTADGLQTERGVVDHKARLSREEGSEKIAPVPRGLPLRDEDKQRDEQRRNLRDPRLARYEDDDQKRGARRGAQDVCMIELVPPRRTYASLADPSGLIYRAEEQPFRVSMEKARTLFSLRDDRGQPVFRNVRPKVTTVRRTRESKSGQEVYETQEDELPIPEHYRHIVERQRPDAQADEDEVVMTQRGMVPKGRRDVDYQGREDVRTQGDHVISDRATRDRPASVPAGGERNMGDVSNDEVVRRGGVKV